MEIPSIIVYFRYYRGYPKCGSLIPHSKLCFSSCYRTSRIRFRQLADTPRICFSVLHDLLWSDLVSLSYFAVGLVTYLMGVCFFPRTDSSTPDHSFRFVAIYSSLLGIFVFSFIPTRFSSGFQFKRKGVKATPYGDFFEYLSRSCRNPLGAEGVFLFLSLSGSPFFFFVSDRRRSRCS